MRSGRAVRILVRLRSTLFGRAGCQSKCNHKRFHICFARKRIPQPHLSSERCFLWSVALIRHRLLMAAGNATFFIHAMLGFGSLSLAWDRASQEAKSLGYRHGGVALQGLQTAINVFSQDNADAVLASSVVLSWQANDFHAWHSLISGIRTVSR